MKIEHEEKFIKGVERMIQPMKVNNLLFFQNLKGLLPPSLLKGSPIQIAKRHCSQQARREKFFWI
jgi:hypothetical protein